MRHSIAARALCGAVMVSALAVPTRIERRAAELVDLEQFGTFPTMTPEEARTGANLNVSRLFEAGEYDDDKLFSSPASKGREVVAARQAAGCDVNNPAVRLEWRNYADNDKSAFVSAIECLMDAPSAGGFQGSQSRYEDLVSVHQQSTPGIHTVAQFLPWHRYFVGVFESLLREECGFDRAMPWWDETRDSGNFAASGLFTDAYFSPLPAKTADGQGTCISSGTFGGDTLHVGPGSGFSDHCLARAVDESLTANVNSGFVSDCNSRASYDDMRGCVELGPHAYGHNGVGAVMAEVAASVGDPVFFMHHLFIDRTFRIWQNADPARATSINGCADTNNPCAPISMDHVLSSNGLRPDTTVGAVMSTTGGYFCYRYDY